MVTAISAIVLLGILIFVHELGHFIIAKLSGVGVVKFSLGFGPKLLSKKIGETEYLLSAVPLGGYVKMIGEDPDEEEEVSEEDQHKSFSNKPLIKRTAIVLAGPLFNIIFAVFVLSIIYMSGVPILKSEVGDVMEGAPAYNAGIKKGDLIISINEEEISQWDELTKIIQNSEGRELDVRVERGDAYYNFLLKPELLPGKNIFGEDIESYKIGITPSEEFITKKYNPFAAAWKGLEQTWRLTKLIGLIIVKLIERAVPAETVGGPIFIIQMAGEQAQAGLMNYLSFMAAISINLGIINLFPIPILDGGHLLFFLLEAIMGRPISLRKREVAQQIGLGIIILLIVFVFYNDLHRVFAK